MRYKTYLSLVRALSGLEYKRIPLEKLSAYFLAVTVYHFAGKGAIKKIKALIKIFFFVPRLKHFGSKSDALYIYSIIRHDYERLADAYIEKMGIDFERLAVSGQIRGWRFNFDVYAFIAAHKFSVAANSGQYFHLFMSVYPALASLNYFEKKIDASKFRTCLSFNSSYEYESVITLLMRYSGVKTYTLQHGMYYEYKNEVPFEMIGMYFSTAEIFYAWGAFTRDQLKDYLEPFTKIDVVGNPLYKNRSFSSSFKPGSRRVLVCLPRITYDQEIVKLLKILSDDIFFNYQFVVRPHPSLNRNKISDLCRVNGISVSEKKLLEDEYAGGFRAVLGFNSTTLFESQFYELPVLQYLSGNDEFYGVGFKEFSDANELYELLVDDEILSGLNNPAYYFGECQPNE